MYLLLSKTIFQKSYLFLITMFAGFFGSMRCNDDRTGSTPGRRPSHTEPEEVVAEVEVANPEKSAAVPVKMVPAPPPKVNIWERRKTEAAQQQHRTAPAQSTEAPDAEADETETAGDDVAAKDLSKEEREDSPAVNSRN